MEITQVPTLEPSHPSKNYGRYCSYISWTAPFSGDAKDIFCPPQKGQFIYTLLFQRLQKDGTTQREHAIVEGVWRIYRPKDCTAPGEICNFGCRIKGVLPKRLHHAEGLCNFGSEVTCMLPKRLHRAGGICKFGGEMTGTLPRRSYRAGEYVILDVR